MESYRGADPDGAGKLAGAAQFLESLVQLGYSATSSDRGGGIAADSIIRYFHHELSVTDFQT